MWRAFKSSNSFPSLNICHNQSWTSRSSLRPLALSLCLSHGSVCKDTGSERDDESFGMAYRQVKLQERKLMTLLKSYQDAMKVIPFPRNSLMNVMESDDKNLLGAPRKVLTRQSQREANHFERSSELFGVLEDLPSSNESDPDGSTLLTLALVNTVRLSPRYLFSMSPSLNLMPLAMLIFSSTFCAGRCQHTRFGR